MGHQQQQRGIKRFKLPSNIFLKELQFTTRLSSSPHPSSSLFHHVETTSKKVSSFGHSSCITCMALISNRNELVTGSDNGEICTWNINTGKHLNDLKGHTKSVKCLILAQYHLDNDDDLKLVSGSSDNTIKIWKITESQCLYTLKMDAHVHCLVLLANRHQLASGYWDNTIKIWCLDTGECIKTLRSHTSYILSLAFNSTTQELVSGSADFTIKIWDINKDMCKRTLQGHTKWVLCLVLISGEKLISGSEDRTIKIWDLSTGVCIKTLRSHNHYVDALVFIPGTHELVSGSWDRTIKVWDTVTGSCLKTLKGHSSLINSLVLAANSNELVSSSYAGHVKIWDLSKGVCLKSHKSFINEICFV
jgi:WD40 repeat protein